MIGIKTGKQVHNRLQRKLSKFAGNFHVQFLNRRGLKVFVSRAPIHVKYIKLPYISNYSQKEEQEIINHVAKIVSPRRLMKLKKERRKSYKR